jgi:hypothetical protein
LGFRKRSKPGPIFHFLAEFSEVQLISMQRENDYTLPYSCNHYIKEGHVLKYFRNESGKLKKNQTKFLSALR